MAVTTQRVISVGGRIYVIHSQHLSKEAAQAEAVLLKRRTGSRTMVRQYRRSPLADPRWAVYSA